jgi:GDP-L-fucose synthase
MFLVTGANGFIGSYISDRLEREGHQVYRATREKIDILDKKACAHLFENERIEYVIHTAVTGGRRTRTDTATDLYQNIVMFENLASCRDRFKMMINFGSGAAFDRTKEISLVQENNVLKETPKDYYGLSKNIIAKRIHGINDNIVNLRIFNCFGESELPDRMVKANCIRHINEEEMVVHSNKKMDFFYIDDLYKVVLTYLEEFSGGSLPIDLNLCYEQKIDLLGIINIINNLTSRTEHVKLVHKAHSLSYTGSPKLIKTLGIKMYGIENAINKVYHSLQGAQQNE